MIFWVFIDLWLIKDTPEEAAFPAFDTADASSGLMHVELSTLDLLKKVFASKLMLLIALIGLTSGIFRNGVTQWYFIFAAEVKQPGAEFYEQHWGLLLCIFGIVGGFFGGWVSDNFFQSRRAPPAAMLSALVVGLTLLMAAYLYSAPVFLGLCCVLVVMAAVGLTSLMAGTAATDLWRAQGHGNLFRHRGRLHLSCGSAIQSFFIGHLCPVKMPAASRHVHGRHTQLALVAAVHGAIALSPSGRGD